MPTSPSASSSLPKPDSPSQKKQQPLPWTHQETTCLIQAYQEKWYSLDKGHLKASQWEEISVTVGARCGYDEPTKSVIQCRHKIEKLRKRYRAERQLPFSSWQYFSLMDHMEKGPFPISAQPMSIIKYGDDGFQGIANENDNNDEDDNDDGRRTGKSSSINLILQRPAVANRFSSAEKRVVGDGGLEEGEGKERREEVILELSVEIRAFAERLIKMETEKIEVMREAERYRMDMESKRVEMILESQRKIVDTIGRALSYSKKLKMNHDI